MKNENWLDEPSVKKILLAIDPGTTESAWVKMEIESEKILSAGIEENARLLDSTLWLSADYLVIERIKSYGMPVGDSCFMTMFWCGRFLSRWLACGGQEEHFAFLPRKTICQVVCQGVTASDANVRRALLDRWNNLPVSLEERGVGGAQKEKRCREPSVGTKSNPGPLWGFRGDMWAALAVAVAWLELNQDKV